MALLSGVWCAVVASRPGNESFAAKAADWMRDNHLSAVANWMEHSWYTRQQPPTGGTPSRRIAVSPVLPVPPMVASTPSSSPPAPLAPLADPPLQNEGVWAPIGPVVDGHPTVLEAQLRPDGSHTSVLGAVVWIDPKVARLEVIPGTVEPGGAWDVVGTLPPEQRGHWIAAFNGGFRLKDSAGGLYTQGRAARDLVDGAASLVIRRDGAVDVGVWGRDDRMGATIDTVRQNLALIVDDGRPVDGLDQNDHHRWGHTLGNKVFVWRSGVGIRADGTLIYAASNGLSIKTLADLLQHAGCVRGMELDINPEWVTFNVYQHTDPNRPDILAGTKLLPDMHRAAARYLAPDSRDFVAILAK